jgi:hypothetical protein
LPRAKIIPGKRYTGQQLRQLIGQQEAKELEMQGYVLQFDAVSRTYAVVPWQQASAAMRMDAPDPAQRQLVSGSHQFDPSELPPIVKRTPAQRVDSLMLKWIEDMKAAGTIPGVDDAKVKEIVGEAWKSGRTEITAEIVRKVAAHFLADAENKREAANFKRTVRI